MCCVCAPIEIRPYTTPIAGQSGAIRPPDSCQFYVAVDGGRCAGGGGAFSDKCPTISDQHGGQWSASPIIDEPDTDTTTTDWDTSDDMARGYLHAIWPIESEYYLHTNMGPTNMRRPEHANIIYNKQSPPRPLPPSTHISMKCLTKAANMYSTRTQISACRSFLDRNYNVHLQLIATRIIF